MIQHASIDDSTLFERITRHDAEAFGIVMRRYAGALYAFAFRIVGDTLAAEDIVPPAHPYVIFCISPFVIYP